MKTLTLERAIELAAIHHAGVKDKAGVHYILHPIAVMMQLKTEKERIVGVLHDTLEDTDLTVEMLREEGASEEIIEALLSVTRRKGETYKQFIERVKQNRIGVEVKLADLNHNLDPTRSMAIPGWESLKLKYEAARKSLLAYKEYHAKEKALRREKDLIDML
jgi:(p)ppGpp synthase/HD superfamily hydrolase